MFRIRKVQANLNNDIQIIHLSDMHWYYERDIKLFCDRLRQALENAEPQKTVIVSTGDWVCEKSDMLLARLLWWKDRDTDWEKIALEVKQVHELLKPFPYKFTCWGNHDLGHPSFFSFRKVLKKSFDDGGINTVLDQGKREPVYEDLSLGKQKVRVIITHDYCPETDHKEQYCEQTLFDQKYLERIQQLAGEDTLSLVLTHNAAWIEAYQEKLQNVKSCFFFAGHTHNGLINILGIKHLALWKLRYRSKLIAGTYQLHQKGIHKKKGHISLQNPTVIVSQGLGDAPIFRPLRWNCPYEIIDISLSLHVDSSGIHRNG